MRRLAVALAVATLVAPAAPATARTSTETGWRTVNEFQGVRAQACLLESDEDYPNHILFRINAQHLERGWARSILSYKRPTDADWRGWIISHKAYPGEVHEGQPGSTEYDPKALRTRIRIVGGADRFKRFHWDDLLLCPEGAAPFPTAHG